MANLGWGLCKIEKIEFWSLDLHSNPPKIRYLHHGLFFKKYIFAFRKTHILFFPCFIPPPFLKCAFGCIKATEHVFPSVFYSHAALGIQPQFLYEIRVSHVAPGLIRASSVWIKGAECSDSDWFPIPGLPLKMLIACKWAQGDSLSLVQGEFFKLALFIEATKRTQIARRKKWSWYNQCIFGYELQYMAPVFQ